MNTTKKDGFRGQYNDCSSPCERDIAGGVIIDPSYHHHPNTFNFLLVKQRINHLWSLPKGHLLPQEKPYHGALREIWEETGFDFKRLHHGCDYQLRGPIYYYNISLWFFFLLRPGRILRQGKPNEEEIEDTTWINLTRISRLIRNKNPKFRCNRTLHQRILNSIKSQCYAYAETFHVTARGNTRHTYKRRKWHREPSEEKGQIVFEKVPLISEASDPNQSNQN